MKLRMIDMGRLNSATKYPSIPTYHELGNRGGLTETVQVPFDDADELVITEKINGANVRIILFPDGAYVIGCRKELLYARGDLLYHPEQGIVDGVRELADQFAKTQLHFPDHVLVLYGEVHGGNIGKGAKQYTGHQSVGFRLFDLIRFEKNELADLVFAHDREEIARWRKHGGQPFVDVGALEGYASILQVDTVPRLEDVPPLPGALGATLEWLNAMLPDRRTQAALDDDAGGRAEGVVVRTKDRSKIAKMRFDSYERTMHAKKESTVP